MASPCTSITADNIVRLNQMYSLELQDMHSTDRLGLKLVEK